MKYIRNLLLENEVMELFINSNTKFISELQYININIAFQKSNTFIVMIGSLAVKLKNLIINIMMHTNNPGIVRLIEALKETGEIINEIYLIVFNRNLFIDKVSLRLM